MNSLRKKESSSTFFHIVLNIKNLNKETKDIQRQGSKKQIKKYLGLSKQIVIKMSYFPDPPGSNITVKLNLENYATKEEVKAATGVDTSSFAKKTELSDVKSEIKNFVSKTDFDNKVNVLIHKNLDTGEIDKRIKDTKKIFWARCKMLVKL